MPDLPVVRQVGVSRPGVCGVRDNAATLAAALRDRGVPSEVVWADVPPPRGFGAALAADLALVRRVRAAARDGVVVLHWSPFVFGRSGVPLLAPLAPLLGRRRVVSVLHELAYPWRREARGLVWAVAQRVALVPVVLGSAQLAVATEARAQWMRRRFGVRAAVVPVWSAIEPVAARAEMPGRLTVFGWGAVPGRERGLALDALRALSGQRAGVTLRLVGGETASPMLAAWRAEAAARGLAGRVEVTGPLPPDGVSAELAAAAVHLHLEERGPTARKSGLAAALAHGLPVVALDGPDTWAVLRRDRAVRLVPRSAAALAGAVGDLLDAPGERVALGERARRFYAAEQSLDAAAEHYRRLLGEVAAG